MMRLEGMRGFPMVFNGKNQPIFQQECDGLSNYNKTNNHHRKSGTLRAELRAEWEKLDEASCTTSGGFHSAFLLSFRECGKARRKTDCRTAWTTKDSLYKWFKCTASAKCFKDFRTEQLWHFDIVLRFPFSFLQNIIIFIIAVDTIVAKFHYYFQFSANLVLLNCEKYLIWSIFFEEARFNRNSRLIVHQLLQNGKFLSLSIYYRINS